VPLSAGIIIAIGNVTLVFTENFSLGGIALGSIVAVAGWHVARALAPAEMREALRREGLHPVAGSTFGHVHGDELLPDPSTVDEVGRPGVPHNHGEGTLNR
jgi:hypothetical protein